MWLLLAFLSAAFLGLYDAAKKQALRDNAVLPVLWLNTAFSTLFFLPVLLTDLGTGGGEEHLMVLFKAIIVLSSWIFGYFGLKHLPLTIVGPINATRPVMVLLGAMLLFGERLNAWQWAGVLLSLFSLLLLSRSSRKEGVSFRHNRWILLVALSAITGAMSGLYDRYIMIRLEPLFVQGWYNLYQWLLMSGIVALLWWPTRRRTTPFHWSWAIPLISITLTVADLVYLKALSEPEAMISVVSMVRRSSVVISFACGALFFKERNLRSKALDLLFILIGMLFLYWGTR
uniref:EamA family transporter n=1 Tax=Alistipes sp. TaxID=1872444 RepID=UPI0040572D0E